MGAASAAAAIVAAGFAGCAYNAALDSVDAARSQAATARDHEERALRAYVSIETAPAPAPDDEGLPGMALTVENVGQTPAYRVHILPIVSIRGGDDPPTQGWPAGDCEHITATAAGGRSLARVPINERYGVGPSRTEQARAAVASGPYEVRADIEVCYRDVFDTVRHVRMCRRYFGGWTRTIPCRGEQDEHS